MNAFGDQATGLRRLLRRELPQVVSVVGFGVDALRWIATEAKSSANNGREVLAFDEVATCGNLADALALPARFDLLQAVERHVSIDSVRIEAGRGLTLYPAARMARALVGADRILAARFAETCQRLQRGADLWLVHANLSERFDLSPLAFAAHRLVIVVDGSARAITQAYALIKHLDGGPWPQVDIALAGQRSRHEADALLMNLSRTVLAQTSLVLRPVRELEASAAAAAVVSDELAHERFLERVLGFARHGSRPLALAL
ncbi:MAG: hypothetical protein FWD62_13135 [Betaproteobacteria bacterium]|nr:hypothetical protein [Betaproteobacteria bacterium]